jgi:TOBE domain-containing protein
VRLEDDGWRAGQRAWLVVPRERIRVGDAARNAHTRHPAIVEAQSYFGSATLYTLRVGDLRLVANVPSGAGAPPRIGDQVTIGWDHGDAFARHDG